jgi:hypothetical protein
MLSSTRSKVDFVPNGVVVEQQKVVEESIVASLSIIAEEQKDGPTVVLERKGTVLPDVMITATHMLTQ